MEAVEWPNNLRPTPEELRKDEEFLQKYERGDLKFKPLSEKQRARMERLRAQPYTICTILGHGLEFTIEMRCACGKEESFDQAASRPYIAHRDIFVEKHRDCVPQKRKNSES